MSSKFEKWWRENESLLAQSYDGNHWKGIYQLLQKAHKAGRRSVLDDIEQEIEGDTECDEWSRELLIGKSVVQELL